MSAFVQGAYEAITPNLCNGKTDDASCAMFDGLCARRKVLNGNALKRTQLLDCSWFVFVCAGALTRSEG